MFYLRNNSLCSISDFIIKNAIKPMKKNTGNTLLEIKKSWIKSKIINIFPLYPNPK